MAALCEEVVDDPDGGITARRIIHTITRTVEGRAVPASLPAFSHDLSLLLLLWPGKGMRGAQKVAFQTLYPVGESPAAVTAEVVMNEGRLARVASVLTIPFIVEGMHHFPVTIGEQHVAEIPLRVVYVPRGCDAAGELNVIAKSVRSIAVFVERVTGICRLIPSGRRRRRGSWRHRL